MGRVLSTEQARSSITTLQNIINGGSVQQAIDDLKREGSTLSDPNVWDGDLAARFRNDIWPATETALRNLQTELEDLRSQVDTINTNIMTAGGNA